VAGELKERAKGFLAKRTTLYGLAARRKGTAFERERRGRKNWECKWTEKKRRSREAKSGREQVLTITQQHQVRDRYI